MSRSDQRRRRALRAAAPVAGLLAVGLLVWQGSTAAFSATTDNGSENWATGSLTLTNDGGTGTYAASTTAVFNETALKIPTATAVSKCVNVKAGGTTGGTLNFYRGAISGTNSATLAPQIAADRQGQCRERHRPHGQHRLHRLRCPLATVATDHALGPADDVRHRPRRHRRSRRARSTSPTSSPTRSPAPAATLATTHCSRSNAAAVFNWEIQ